MNSIYIKEKNGIILNLYIQPGTSADEFAGMYNERLKIRIKAKAVDGSANESLCRFISRHFSVNKSSVILLSGTKAREKRVFIAGDAEDLALKAQQLSQTGARSSGGQQSS